MESSNELKLWLQKLHEQLHSKNQVLKTSLLDKQQVSAELSNDIDNISNNSVNTSTLSIDVIPNNVQNQLKKSVNNLKIRSEQLDICNETINAQVEEETRKMRNAYYNMITKDDTALKPYHEVEEAINELTREIDSSKKKHNADKEKFMRSLKDRELVYTEIKGATMILESTEQEMRLSIQHCNKIFELKLKSVELNSIEEASEESTESKALLLDISNMNHQMNL